MTQASTHAPAGHRLWALIACAGSGQRAGGEAPKQYQPIAGKPMVRHTLAAFAQVTRLSGTLVVVAPGDRFFSHSETGLMVAHCGGASRAQSVRNGLEQLRTMGAQEQDWVLVHDAARCLVSTAQVDALIDACADDSVGGLLALRLSDTLKCESAGRVCATIERSDKWLAQTPQMFRLGMLHAALADAGAYLTDESSAIEALGRRPKLVPGSARNFKVTFPSDFALAEALLVRRSEPGPAGPAEYDYP